MMEPHASIAAWDGEQAHRLDFEPDDRLGPSATWPRRSASPEENVRLMSPFIGGGFGGKLFLRADAVLAALGARAAGRPVKVALTTADDVQQHDASSGDHPAHPHRREPDGKITAIGTRARRAISRTAARDGGRRRPGCSTPAPTG